MLYGHASGAPGAHNGEVLKKKPTPQQTRSWAFSTGGPHIPKDPREMERAGLGDGVRPAAEGTRGVGCGAIYCAHN